MLVNDVVLSQAMLLDVVDGVYSADAAWTGMVREDLSALTAGSFPVRPPRSWFADPGFSQVTPLTVEASGQAYGHIATWKQSHVGLAGGVKAPRSRSNYAFFATGVVQCDDDTFVNVGQITLAGGHASLEASVADAVAHYDNTKSGVLDVAVGEDEHGIWAAGSIRPDVDDIQLRTLRASSVSGDWRPINGNLELVAVCAVNVPGFPIPRARVASGQVMAVVAAGTEELVDVAIRDRMGVNLSELVASATGDLDVRVRLIEDALLDRVRERRVGLSAAIDAIKSGDSTGAEASLVASAAPATPPPVKWEDGLSMDLTIDECLQASLRARVKGLVASASGSWTEEKRRDAAEKGQALPDGSFPIRSKDDWKNAKQALGRAKNRARAVQHLRRRGEALGIAKDEIKSLAAAATD